MTPLRRPVITGTSTDSGVALAETAAAQRFSRVLDCPLLIGWGYDPATRIFAPDRDHPLLGYPVCRVGGCGYEAWQPDGLCGGCRSRFAAGGGDLDAFAARGVARKNRSRDRCCLVCRVPGFERPVGANDLCNACDGLRRRRRQSVGAYVTGDDRFGPAVPRPGLGTCTVAACGRLAAHPPNSSNTCPKRKSNSPTAIKNSPRPARSTAN